MRRQWIVLLVVLFLGIVAATTIAVYLVHADLVKLSYEVTALNERVLALEIRRSAQASTAAITGIVPPATSGPIPASTLFFPEVNLASQAPTEIGAELAKELQLDDEKRGEINRRLHRFFTQEASLLAETTRTASGRIEMSIRTDDQYRRERQARWHRLLTNEIAPLLTEGQMERLRREMTPAGSPPTTGALQIRW